MAVNLVSFHNGAVNIAPFSTEEEEALECFKHVYPPFTLNNSFCVLHEEAGSIFRLLKSKYPQGGTVNWLDVKAEPLTDDEVEAYRHQHDKYTDHPSNNATIAGFKAMLDQKRQRCEEGARRAYNLFHRLRELNGGARSLITNDRYAESLWKEVAEAKLTSTCLFGLSVPPTASCYTKIREQIEQKLQKEKLPYESDDLWSLCRELEPRMQQDTFKSKLGQLVLIINTNTEEILKLCIAAKEAKKLTLEQAIDQYPFPNSERDAHLFKHILHLVAKLADMDPDTDSGYFRQCCKTSFCSVIYMALPEVGREGKYYQKWLERAPNVQITAP